MTCGGGIGIICAGRWGCCFCCGCGIVFGGMFRFLHFFFHPLLL